MDATSQTYWNNRWLTQETGWDMGHASPPLIRFAQQLADKDISILIPGCGNAHEAVYLLDNGFTNITLLDISPLLVNDLIKRFFPYINKGLQVICDDFFDHRGQYDLILEQTFFCALHPSLRNAYVKHMHELLRPHGVLAGLLFNKEIPDGPPFGGTEAEYKLLFQSLFSIQEMEPCEDSITPRVGSELFFICHKKH